MESNDSPEIPDRGETSDIPGLPSGALVLENHNNSPFLCTQPLPSLSPPKHTFIILCLERSHCALHSILSLSLACAHTHTYTHSLSLLHVHTHTHTHSLSLSHVHTHTHTYTLSLSHVHTHTYTLSLSLSHVHTHTHTHTLSLLHSLDRNYNTYTARHVQ